jgi:tetratricopeptide (TPR) repeat protein
MNTQDRTRVFVSYSHKDKPWLEKFNNVIAPDIRNNRIDYWDDHDLKPGDPWYEKILEMINSAKVAVLLVSPNFLASRFIMEEELPRILAARDEGLTIIWIPLYGLFFETDNLPNYEEISKIQAACDTSKNLADQDSTSQIATLLSVCKNIQRILNPGRIPWNLPFNSLIELFKGRNMFLDNLHYNLHQHGSAAILQPHVIHGLGGIGKTRIAIEYSWRHQNDFDAFLFVSANKPDDLERNLAALCRPGDCLDLPEYKSPNQDEQRDAVIRWLQQNKNWLLILDNVDTDEGVCAVKSLAAKLRGGHILITSRITEWGRGVRSLALDVLPIEDAVDLLLEFAKGWRYIDPDDEKQARILADRLGCLPLALTHAAAYMQHHYKKFSSYLEDFESHFERLLTYHDHLAIEYETELESEEKEKYTKEEKATRRQQLKTVATTFFLSFDRLSPEAKAILQSASFLAPEPIPIALFEKCSKETMELIKLWCEEHNDVPKEKTLEDALPELSRYSLISRSEKFFSVHRMEQRVLRFQIPKNEAKKWIQKLKTLLNGYRPKEHAENPKTWIVWDTLRSHAETILKILDPNEMDEIDLELFGSLGSLYYGKGLFEQNLEVDKFLLQVAKRLNNKDNNEVAFRLLNLGESLRALGRYEEAESYFKKALSIEEEVNGADSIKVAESLNYLALAADSLGRTDDAESYQRRALEIYEAKGTDDDKHSFAKTLDNLGNICNSKGNTSDGELFHRKALQLHKESVGLEHPHALICRFNLAQTLLLKGDMSEAESHFKTAFEMTKQTLGWEHPNTLTTMRGLAELLEKTNRKDEAINLNLHYIECLPDNIVWKNQLWARQLAATMFSTGKLDEAEKLLRKLLANKFEYPGTSCHIARILILTERAEEAQIHIANAWMHRDEAPSYVLARIVWFRILFAILNTVDKNVYEAKEVEVLIGKLKTILENSSSFMEWNMSLILNHIKRKLTDEEHTLLTALIAALSDRKNVEKLNEFAEWREAKPINIE